MDSLVKRAMEHDVNAFAQLIERLYREENEDGKGRVVPFQLKEVENYVR